MAALVSLLRGVEATTQTSCFLLEESSIALEEGSIVLEESLIAVERPPNGRSPKNLEKGFEKVITSGISCIACWGVTW